MFLARLAPTLAESAQRFLGPFVGLAAVVLVAVAPDSGLVGLDFAPAVVAVAADPDFAVGLGSADSVAAVVVAGAVASPSPCCNACHYPLD